MAIGREDYAERRGRLGELLDARGIGAMFVPPSSDLQYLTGLDRDLPTFGNISYPHGWVAGAFVAAGREPLFVLPRMVVDFHLGGTPPEGTVVVQEDADGRTLLARPRATSVRRRESQSGRAPGRRRRSSCSTRCPRPSWWRARRS